MQRADADRSRGRLRTSSIGTQSSRKYVGATPRVEPHQKSTFFLEIKGTFRLSCIQVTENNIQWYWWKDPVDIILCLKNGLVISEL